MRRSISPLKIIALRGMTGAILGILLLHPVTMAIYWFEFHQEHPFFTSIWHFFIYRIYAAFTAKMLIMTFLFALMGGLFGVASGVYSWAITKRDHLLNYFESQLAQDMQSLIRGGEGETVEFKASARWDRKLGRINSALEFTIIKTVAGFLNHRGGNLLIGVEDSGEITGLDPDYATFKHKDRDGFQQFLMALVKTRLGGSVCSSVHMVFQEVAGKDVCRVNHPMPRYTSSTTRCPTISYESAIAAENWMSRRPLGTSPSDMDAIKRNHFLLSSSQSGDLKLDRKMQY